MSKIIKATDVAEAISKKFNIPISELVDTFAEIPETVVKCKDCAYSFEKNGKITCSKHVGLVMCNGKTYCSYGEKEDAE